MRKESLGNLTLQSHRATRESEGNRKLKLKIKIFIVNEL